MPESYEYKERHCIIFGHLLKHIVIFLGWNLKVVSFYRWVKQQIIEYFKESEVTNLFLCCNFILREMDIKLS